MHQNSNAYISDMPSQRANEYSMMSRNESKSSSNFTKPSGGNRMMNRGHTNNENYLMESPDLNHKRMNNKVGVQLAPLGQQT